MTPDLSIRLTSIISSLEDVVIPAIDPKSGIANEQAGMILAHLKIAIDQLPHIQKFDALCLSDAKQTAGKLLNIIIEDKNHDIGLTNLKNTVDKKYESDEDHYREIMKVLENIVSAAHTLTTNYLPDSVINTLLDFSQRQTDRERAWFAAAGFDPEREKMPSVSEVACGNL